MRQLRFTQAIIDRAADRDVRLIETAGIDAAYVHHAQMRGQIGEQRIKQIMWIAVAIEIDRDSAGFAFE